MVLVSAVKFLVFIHCLVSVSVLDGCQWPEAFVACSYRKSRCLRYGNDFPIGTHPFIYEDQSFNRRLIVTTDFLWCHSGSPTSWGACHDEGSRLRARASNTHQFNSDVDCPRFPRDLVRISRGDGEIEEDEVSGTISAIFLMP
jgi:hypothetical protein